jgi:predicted ATPase/DNA-binding winged helix-turn-helix (wHTH) protein
VDTSTSISAPGAPAIDADYEFDGYRLDTTAGALLRDGARIELNPRAFDLLLALVRAAGTVVPRDVLLRAAWHSTATTDANLRVQISTLRKVLAAHGGAGRHIDSVPGKGYCFVARVRWRAADASPDMPGAPDRPGGPAEEGDAAPFGRDEAVAHIAELLREKGLVTLAGTGGVGKSAVARAVAARFSAAGLPTATLDLALPASVLALPFAAAPSVLILENCEFDTDLAATTVQALARHHPGLPVLAVSRESLQLSRETVFRLPPLALPPRGAGLTLSEACRYAAVQLFCSRARVHCDSFHVDDGDVPELIELCQALDGLPLALELAARQTAWRRYAELLPSAPETNTNTNTSTNTNMDTAAGSGAQPAPARPARGAARQRSMWQSLDWSFQRLSAREQTALCRLSVFRSGFGLISVSCALTGCGLPESLVLPTLQSLVAKSLVMVERGPDVTLYRLLNSTKAYALERYVARRRQCRASYPTNLQQLPPLLLPDLFL